MRAFFGVILAVGPWLMATMVGTAPQLRRDVDAVLRVFENDDDTDPGLGPEGLAAAATQMLQLVRLTQEHRGMSAAVLNGDAGKQAERAEQTDRAATSGTPPAPASSTAALRSANRQLPWIGRDHIEP